MAATKQLRILLWKNWLQQRRSCCFTVFEVIIPCVLLAFLLGLFLLMASFIEHPHDEKKFSAWPVTGTAADLFMPTAQSFGNETIIGPGFASGNDADCQFLKKTKLGANNYQIDVAFAYAPKTTETDRIMQALGAMFSLNNVLLGGSAVMQSVYGKQLTVSVKPETKGFASEEKMVDYMSENLDDKCNNPLMAGIVFDDSIAKDLKKETELKYTIRLSNTNRRAEKSTWKTALMFAPDVLTGPVNENDNDGGSPYYWREGFLTVQRAVDHAIIALLTNQVSPDVQLVRFPFPKYTEKVIKIASVALPVVIPFCYMMSVIYIARSVVMEKEDRLKEYMRVMGLSQFINWTAHFIINYAKLMLSVIVVTFFVWRLAPDSSVILIFVFFMLYAFNVVYVAFFVTTFLSSATISAMMAIVVWVMLFVWSMAVVQSANTYSLGVALLHSLNPDIALQYGLSLLATYEIQSKGLMFGKLFTTPSPDSAMTFGYAMMALVFDGFLLVILTWYVEAVYPGGDGVPQKPWFFVQKSYWFPYSVAVTSAGSTTSSTNSTPPGNRAQAGGSQVTPGSKASTESKATQGSKATPGSKASQGSSGHVKLEPVSADMKPSIDIVNLTKIYGASVFKKLMSCKFDKSGEKLAVDNLNFKIYPNQCTVLLGHNGAGKSTTFSVLTGVASPTSGTVYVNGLDIRTALPKIRQQMGLCPQYNTLFSFLTVMEHLEFFAKLKQREWNPEEATQILDRLRIGFKANAMSGTLSGGQKRKLSLAIALIGGSEIVMLDEPTSGMDPGARHETWTLIQQEKTRRTILLSTHFMEEADLLGDRIAVVAHGQLECCGSSMFLKKQFGDGYHLTIVFSLTDNPDINQTTKIIQSFIPDAEVDSNIGQEATYLLAAKYRPVFPKLFQALEQNQKKCGISSFGTSITTLEEVFLKVNQLAEKRHNAENGQNESELISKDDPQLKVLNAETRLTGFALQLQHFKAMILKRALYLYRTWPQFVPLFLFPIFYFGLILYSATASDGPTQPQDPVTISFAPFSESGSSYVISDSGNFMSGKLSKQAENIKDKMGYDEVEAVSNVDKFIIESIEENGARSFALNYPIAVKPDKTGLLAYFNNMGLFTPALAISFADSLILSELAKKPYSITVVNHPLPPTSDEIIKGSKQGNFIFAHGLTVAYAIIVAGFALFLITERKKKAKHMQFLSGIRPWMFWLGAFVWDAMIFLLETIFFIVALYIFSVEDLTRDFSTVLALFASFLLFGWAVIPITYFFQFFFTSAPKGFTMIVMYHILTQLIGFIAIMILTAAKGVDAAYTWKIILALLSPTFSLSHIADVLESNEKKRKACEEVDCKNKLMASMPCCLTGSDRIYVDSVMTTAGQKGALIFLIVFFCQGILFWTWVFMKEADQMGRVFGAVKGMLSRRQVDEADKTSREQLVEEDSDVIAEKAVVQDMMSKTGTAVLMCNNLMKRYGRNMAVKGVNFHVNAKNCFGLLGVNGAGKTSTFQMLTGENRPTSGDAFVDGWSVCKNWREAGANIGYCPQYDAIIKELTGEETLYMYARIRGIPGAEQEAKVNAVIHSIGIGMYAKKRIETYSGGNKRRLSLGIALIGLPKVLLLDEPTSGVDPKARRIIWNILNRVRDLGTALVLTSHSMDECEALCTELAIMIYGKFRCYGSCQHIKSRYGSGYTLLIRLKNKSGVEGTKQAVEKTFPGSKITEEHIMQLNYDIPRGTYTWSQLFDQLEKVSQQLHWDDYSLSQTTLEQVFVEFSRNANAPST